MASSLQLVPSDGADAAATFRQLGINFSIAEAVTDALGGEGSSGVGRRVAILQTVRTRSVSHLGI